MNRITTLCSLAILVLAACSKEKVRGLDMPELRLTAGIEAMTRTTADDNAWTGGEQVAVESTSSTEGIQSEVKIYTAAADGTLTTDIPFGWTRDDERKRFRAWYCADGSSAAGGANATAAPDKWTVKADQRGEGYAQSDLLFAATEASYSDYVANPVPMKFYHQISKVVVNIVKSEYATSAERISSVHIGGDLLLEASYVAPDAGGAMMGDWGSGGTRGVAMDMWMSKCQTKAQNYNDINGYGNCEHIRSCFYFSSCPAIKAAYDYNTTCPVPQTTTGWYLPPASGGTSY